MAEQNPTVQAIGPGIARPFLDAIVKNGDVAFALAIIGIIIVLILPIPTVFLDILLAFSVTSSILILLTCLFILKPLEFSAFPTILLVTAMLRLSLNIASTRLILANGHTSTAAAGHVIEAFGRFVMEGNVVIGAIVFIILTIINFVVITKGSGRIAEVAARFSLDAMPGKQMAIDADLSAGLIDENTAKIRRKELEDESTFFGSMDGANKFVRGDAIAGIMITFINFVAGIIIGVVQRGMSFPNALKAYTTLTIGDGLVSQIPALIISLSAGLLVSKSGAVGSTDQIIFSQFGKHPRAMWLCSGLSAGIALVPGLPAIPFILIAAATAMIASTMKKAADAAAQGTQATAGSPAGTKSEQQTAGAASAAAPEEDIASTLHIDSIKLELSYLLLPLIHYQKGNRLTEQIKALRKQMARDLGFIIPSVRIQDNMQLTNNTYVIKIKDIECARGEVKPNMLLVMDAKGGEITIPGEDTKEPAFGLAAKWITDNYREEALFRNYTVVDPPTVITTHLTEVVKENITELLSYSETQKLLDSIEESHKKLVTDTIGGQISVSGIQRVLQNLLSEGVSIRDLPTIIEAIAEAGRVSGTTLTQITEHVRTRLSRQISHANTTADNYIPIMTLSPQWEQTFTESLVGTGSDKQLSMSPSKLQEFIYAVKRTFDEQIIHGHLPVLLVSPTIRPYVRSVIERFRPITVIMSQNEVHPKAKLKTLGQIV